MFIAVVSVVSGDCVVGSGDRCELVMVTMVMMIDVSW